MKIAMAQLSMTENILENFKKTLGYINEAKDCDIIFFPEIQLTPFFPQHRNTNVMEYAVKPENEMIKEIEKHCKKYGLYASPNVYLQLEDKRYDASLWITPDGKTEGISKMVHIAQGECFYEKDYYTESDDGFKVYNTHFGKVGIVICFDRHIPESIRTCALMGAELIIIPTANTKAEPLEMFEWELRVQAMQNNVFIAMCNRVGKEDKMNFAGESIIVSPDGEVLFKADDKEQLIKYDINLSDSLKSRGKRSYIEMLRPEMYRTYGEARNGKQF